MWKCGLEQVLHYSTFKKTVFTLFTRTVSKVNSAEALESLVILGASVVPPSQVQILGVSLDQKLNYKAHIARASQKRVDAALALKRLKNLRPETARRLFQAKVVPVVDYASPIWSPSLSTAIINKLNLPQRVGGQAIIGAFSTVAMIVAESETGLESSIIRHHNQELQTWLKWHTKSASHRFWKVVSALDLESTRLVSPPQKLATKFRFLGDLSTLERFDAYIQPP